MKKLAATLGILFIGSGLSLGQDIPETGKQISVSSVGAVKAAVMPPYRCAFDNLDVLEDEWIVVDGDGDGKTWYWRDHKNYTTFNGDTNSGFILSLFRSASLGGNQADFLITRAPVRIPAGKAYVSFHFGSKMEGFTDSLCVYYGKSADANLENLTYIGHIVNTTKGWKHQVLTFDAPAEGEYYFHFVNRSPADQFGIWLDNIEIGSGVFRGGTPDLSVDRVVLPSSSCDLGNAEKIGVQLTNIGLTDVTAIKMTYSINGAAPVEQMFEGTIGISKTLFFDFEKKADLSGHETYDVVVTAEITACTSEEAEVRTGDNTGTGRVAHFIPAEMPFEVDLRTKDGLAQMGYGATYWILTEGDTNGVNGVVAEAPLATRCMKLESDAKYRFYLRYKAGYMFGDAIFPTDFEILYGLSGTSILTWETLRTYTNETGYTGEMLGEDEFTFENEWEGDYSFAIVPKVDMLGNYNKALYIAELRIESLRAHDVKLAAVQSSIGVLTPAPHAVNPQFNVSVLNRGRESENVNVTVGVGENRIGSSKTLTVNVGDTVHYVFGGTMGKPEAGSEVTLVFEAGMDEIADENPADNRYEWTFTATDDVYAFDDVTMETYGDGIGIQGYPFGHVFTLAEQDTLTAVTFGWFNLSGAVPASFKVGVEVYAMEEDDRVGTCLLSERFDRQLIGGMQTVDLPARVLPAGRYFVALCQLTSTHAALGFDDNPVGYTMILQDGVLKKMSDYGYVALRAVFGKAVSAPAKDVAVNLVRPRERGLFAANEPIEADYINNGHLAMEVEFICSVNGKVVGREKKSVPGYGWGTVRFEADLSQTGLHEIKVEAVTADDEVPENNTALRTVETASFDPYIMDFELCEDFAIKDLAPWKTVDADGQPTSGIVNVLWPNLGEPQAFMAFNPAEVPGSGIDSHEGERVGVVLALTKGKGRNNDWLISPKLKMPAEHASVSFYTKAFRALAYPEKYNVWVSATTDELDEFMQIGETYTAPADWEQTTVNLEMFNNKEIYIAIQCVSDQAWIFMIDDIEVSRPVANEKVTDLSSYVKSYPNPVTDVWTVTAYGLEIDRVEICDMAGCVVFRSAGRLATETYRVNMAGFTPGLYMARVYTNAGVQTLKVVVR